MRRIAAAAVLSLALSLPAGASNTPFWGSVTYFGGCVTAVSQVAGNGCLVEGNVPGSLSSTPVVPGQDFELRFDQYGTGTQGFCPSFASGDYIYVRAFNSATLCSGNLDGCSEHHVVFLYSFMKRAPQCVGVQ